MLIDWFTVVAQAFNFLILVWLMKRFLYKPILNALDARERRIAGELAEAEASKREAAAEREEYRRKNEAFEQQRDALMSKVVSEADAEHRRLFDEVRRDADELRSKLQDKLNTEYGTLHDEIARRTQAEVFAIARKTLTDLADASLEQRIVEVFVQRLREVDGSERDRLAAVLKTTGTALTVRSAFELAPPLRASIEAAIKAALGVDGPLHFETASHLIGGIELLLRGEKMAWSISDHLASLEKELAILLKAQRHES